MKAHVLGSGGRKGGRRAFVSPATPGAVAENVLPPQHAGIIAVGGDIHFHIHIKPCEMMMNFIEKGFSGGNAAAEEQTFGIKYVRQIINTGAEILIKVVTNRSQTGSLLS